MTKIVDYSNLSTDASMVISSRYTETAGIAINVDTGLGVTIGVEMNPFLQFIDAMDLFAPEDNDVTPFAQSEISRLLHLDSITNPVLADIWRDDFNDDFSCS